jgi:multidrug resistance efflux pump
VCHGQAIIAKLEQELQSYKVNLLRQAEGTLNRLRQTQQALEYADHIMASIPMSQTKQFCLRTEWTAAQTRAHALLKSKESELRSAREEARQEGAEQLAAAQLELAAAARELQKVCSWPLLGLVHK